jgi:hypothetical protein
MEWFPLILHIAAYVSTRYKGIRVGCLVFRDTTVSQPVSKPRKKQYRNREKNRIETEKKPCRNPLMRFSHPPPSSIFRLTNSRVSG